MPFETLHSLKSINASVSLAANQFCFVDLNASGQLALSVAGADAIGVLQDKPGAGDPGLVCGPGDITKMQFGGTVAAGAPIISNATGQAVAGTAGSPALGYALQAGAAGAISAVLFQPVATA
jgi:hypothetical protein